MMQKNNKSEWMDPSDDWGQDGGYNTARVQQTGQQQRESRGKAGRMGNLGLQKGELVSFLCIAFYS